MLTPKVLGLFIVTFELIDSYSRFEIRKTWFFEVKAKKMKVKFLEKMIFLIFSKWNVLLFLNKFNILTSKSAETVEGADIARGMYGDYSYGSYEYYYDAQVYINDLNLYKKYLKIIF